MNTPTKRDRQEFAAYLRNCTDAQVINVYWKERKANRRVYAQLAWIEASHRRLDMWGIE